MAAIKFWSRVHITDKCWEWTGPTVGRMRQRYGYFKFSGVRVLAHRMAYRLIYGIDPADTETPYVCHSCDNTICCRGEDLFLGTLADNNADRDMKGRQRFNYDAIKETQFKIGTDHRKAKLTEDNVIKIRTLLESGESAMAIAVMYGVTTGAIYAIKKGETWRHI